MEALLQIKTQTDSKYLLSEIYLHTEGRNNKIVMFVVSVKVLKVVCGRFGLPVRD
jgi:hypothetical protein